MKQLWLMRHAKSSWKEAGCSDFDRRLTHKGEEHVHQLISRGCLDFCKPDWIVSSGAKRALHTAKIVCTELQFASPNIDNRIYEAPLSDLLSVMLQFPNDKNTILVFGHNPGFTQWANYCAGVSIDEIPTAGLLQIVWNVSNWEKAVQTKGTLSHFYFPKAL